MKKMTTFVCVAAITASLLAGCGSKTAETTAASTEAAAATEAASTEAAAEGTAALPGLSAVFTQAAAFSYMAFNLLCMPCFAAVGAIKKDMGSWKWTGITIAFQMITAYIVAFIVYHVCMFIF